MILSLWFRPDFQCEEDWALLIQRFFVLVCLFFLYLEPKKFLQNSQIAKDLGDMPKEQAVTDQISSPKSLATFFWFNFLV